MVHAYSLRSKKGTLYQGAPNEAVFLTLWSYGSIEIDFQWLKFKMPFRDRDKRLELQQRLNLIPGVLITDEQVDRRPSIDSKLLASTEMLERFIAILDWIVEQCEVAWAATNPIDVQLPP
jgi:hypothetical protein